MWRKLTSLLFDEEEIILEEEEIKVEEIKIRPVKPMIEKAVPMDHVEIKPVPVETIEMDVINNPNSVPLHEDKPKKSIKIDITQETFKENFKPKVQTPTETVYKPKNIISPYHGGPDADEIDVKDFKKQNIKKREPLTKVISPMFGKVVETEQEDFEVLAETLMDIDLENMIDTSSQGTEDDEVQTSLYDFLEGLDHDE